MSDHRVEWTHDRDTIVGRIVCTADADQGAAPCRWTCSAASCQDGWSGQAEKDGDGWFHEYDEIDGEVVRHPLRLESCNLVEYIDSSGGIEESYGGGPTEVRSGPVEVLWNGDYYEWWYYHVAAPK